MKTNPHNFAFPKEGQNGLTKRECFSAMAMQVLCADKTMRTEMICEIAVKLADELIKELNKPKTGE